MRYLRLRITRLKEIPEYQSIFQANDPQTIERYVMVDLPPAMDFSKDPEIIRKMELFRAAAFRLLHFEDYYDATEALKDAIEKHENVAEALLFLLEEWVMSFEAKEEVKQNPVWGLNVISLLQILIKSGKCETPMLRSALSRIVGRIYEGHFGDKKLLTEWQERGQKNNLLEYDREDFHKFLLERGYAKSKEISIENLVFGLIGGIVAPVVFLGYLIFFIIPDWSVYSYWWGVGACILLTIISSGFGAFIKYILTPHAYL